MSKNKLLFPERCDVWDTRFIWDFFVLLACLLSIGFLPNPFNQVNTKILYLWSPVENYECLASPGLNISTTWFIFYLTHFLFWIIFHCIYFLSRNLNLHNLLSTQVSKAPTASYFYKIGSIYLPSSPLKCALYCTNI